MQDLYGVSPPLPISSKENQPENTSILPTSGSSPPPSNQDTNMDRTSIDTKDQYQISTRFQHRRLFKSTTPHKIVKYETSENTNTNNNSNTDDDDDEQQQTTPPTSVTKFTCMSCDVRIDNQTDYIQHIREHETNSSKSAEDTSPQYTCRICQKVLSTGASLERHLLVHTGDRPFRCKICSVSFTTNGNMRRHMRTHSGNKSEYESDDSTDSSTTSAGSSTRKSQRMKRRFEYNNNNYNKRKADGLEINSSDENNPPPPPQNSRRRLKTINNNTINSLTPQKYQCPVCNREDFASLNVFEMHLEENHPDYQIKCDQCNLVFKNHRVLNLHRYMGHQNNDSNMENLQKSIIGFKDLTFVDFSSEKFPIIAKELCEKALHRASNENDLNFQCTKCSHGFPCASALEIHQRACLNSDCYNYSATCSEDEKNEPKSEEDIRRSDFFNGLKLQNKSQSSDEQRQTQFLPKIRLKEFLTKSEFLPAMLNHNRDSPNSPQNMDTTKDLADIQSIISVTSAQSLLQQLTAPKCTPTPPNQNIQLPLSLQITPPDSNQRQQMSLQDSHEEEQQDQFASEFRKMKQKGEFPCRLCSAVFPNLRALKGHNRAHLTGNGNGPYRCNMCPHSSTDKAALVRHMRTHNGDRPYECSLCNYAFTTKANCERHLRNRHRKVTREEVKRAIIYHPSEDPTNDESLSGSMKGFTPPRRNDDLITTKLSQISEAKRSLIFSSPTTADKIPSTSVNPLQIPDFRTAMSKMQLSNSQLPNLILPKDENLSSLVRNNSNVLKQHRILPKIPNVLNLSSSSNDDNRQIHTPPVIIPKIQVKDVNELKQIPELDTPAKSEHTDSEPEDTYSNHSNQLTSTPLSHFPRESRPIAAPIDLSMDVLDLSKKKRDVTPEPEIKDHEDSCDEEDSKPQDLTIKTLNQNVMTTPPPSSIFEKSHLLLAQQLLKRDTVFPPVLHPNFYSNFYNTTRPTVPSMATPPQFGNFPGINPCFLQTHPFLTPTTSPQDFQEMKERFQKEFFEKLRGLQMSGGGLIMEHLATEKLQAFQKQTEHKSEENSPLTIDTNQPFNMDTNSRSPMKQSTPKMTENIISHTPNSVKMVIKNGVLMPKQKQRRYRTERPFSCEHCSARFTLRSNMERHIKQQHPQFWSQRQRSNMSAGVPGRKPSLQILPNIQQQTPNYDIHKSMNISNVPKEISPNYSLPPLSDLNKQQPLLISDQVKFAILAQQLKQQSMKQNFSNNVVVNDENTRGNDDEEENDTLVIDEEVSQQSTVAERNNQTSSPLIKPDLLPTILPQQQQSEQKKNLEQKLKMIREKLLQQESNKKQAANESIIEVQKREENIRNEDLVPVSKLLDNAAQIPFREYFRRDTEDTETPSEEEEEGFLATSGSTSEGNISGSDGNRSESEQQHSKNASINSKENNNTDQSSGGPIKKKSAYSLAPNRVICPYCHRKFPWSSSLRRHILTHTGQKPFKCSHCPLLFTTKSNCDRHLLRKHGNLVNQSNPNTSPSTNNTTNDQIATAPSAPATNYMMRNVPERPFKCSTCPSSTFSTLSNLKKHVSCKHSGSTSPTSNKGDGDRPSVTSGSVYDSHSSEDEYNTRVEKIIKNYKNDNWDQQINNNIATADLTTPTNGTIIQPAQNTNSDLPFKCHLCDSSYGDRQDALDHIKDQHTPEYELLLSKGALEQSSQSHPNNDHITENHSDEQDDQINLRGKFPDYANRKVMCAFCMRRFWSAEDLRRHMRTHTGERPFSCDVCRRRFTLKHSMLRHRKKHNNNNNNNNSDVETTAVSGGGNSLITPVGGEENCTDENNVPSSGGEETDLEKPSENNNNNTLLVKSAEEPECGSSDLLSNLLEIRDRSIIDQVLVSSADDAAKLLGVNKSTD